MTHDTISLTQLQITLPFPPFTMSADAADSAFEMDVYTRFMRHLRVVPTSRPDIQILSSIQFAADMTGIEDAQIAKILVDLGLRAPRSAFPDGYLRHADAAIKRSWDSFGAASKPLRELAHVWSDEKPLMA